ncbi:MAG: alcohol dehydrogenase catalytic domain-containing protein [Actinomycetota bacterium]
MKTVAAVLPRTGAPLEIGEVELAAPKDEEVLVRLQASGVCHSDLNAADGTAETRCPAVLGHEGAGVVEAVGDGVTIRPGTRVALSWMPSCGQCEECLRALPHLCRAAWTGMGTGGLLDGTPRLSRRGAPVYHYSYLSTFARHAVVPATCCVPIANDVPAAVAAIVGCAVSTGVGAVWRTADVREGDGVAVFGCGGVGLSAVLGAVSSAAAPIVAVDVSDAKLDMAERVGATSTVGWTTGPEETAAAGRAASGGGVDYAIEATGRPEAMRAAFLSLRPRGAAVLIGIPRPDAVLSLPAATIARRELRVLGSAYGSTWPERDFPATLDRYRDGHLPLDLLITHRLSLGEAQRALDLVRDGVPARAVLELDGDAG